MELQNKIKSAAESFFGWVGFKRVNSNPWHGWDEDDIKAFLRSGQEGVESPSRTKIREILFEFPGATLLDAACGPAVELEGYKKYGINVDYTGSDFTYSMVDHARKIFPGYKFHVGNITCLAEKESSFDIVLARHIFEHLPHYKQAMKECLRVARKRVIVNFFIELNDTEEDIITTRGKDSYNNCYSRRIFESFLTKTLKVREFKNYRNLGASNFSQNEIYLIHK